MTVPPPRPIPGHPYFVVDGRQYPMVPLDSVDAWFFADIQDQTGISPKRFEELVTEIGSMGEPGSPLESEMDLLASREHLTVMVIQLWLARRAAGEVDLTIRQAGMVPIECLTPHPQPGEPGYVESGGESAEDPTPAATASEEPAAE